MIYAVKVRETQIHDVWYKVEADSADEAIDNVFRYGEFINSDYVDTSDTEILEVEPYVD